MIAFEYAFFLIVSSEIFVCAGIKSRLCEMVRNIHQGFDRLVGRSSHPQLDAASLRVEVAPSLLA